MVIGVISEKSHQDINSPCDVTEGPTFFLVCLASQGSELFSFTRRESSGLRHILLLSKNTQMYSVHSKSNMEISITRVMMFYTKYTCIHLYVYIHIWTNTYTHRYICMCVCVYNIIYTNMTISIYNFIIFPLYFKGNLAGVRKLGNNSL